jgi:hypothetical protein
MYPFCPRAAGRSAAVALTRLSAPAALVRSRRCNHQHQHIHIHIHSHKLQLPPEPCSHFHQLARTPLRHPCSSRPVARHHALLLSIISSIKNYSMLRIQARAGCVIACQLMGTRHPVKPVRLRHYYSRPCANCRPWKNLQVHLRGHAHAPRHAELALHITAITAWLGNGDFQ